jgi:hypothetical protein
VRTLQFIVMEESWASSPLSQLQQPAFGGGRKCFPGGRPSVVAEDLSGDRYVLAVLQTVEEAQERAKAVERDFDGLSRTEWCKRYDVPLSFGQG